MRTRRVIYSLLLGVMCCLCGCKDNRATLYVYTWSDYIDPELIAEFEAKYDCHVNIDTFDDNESMVAKLLAGGGGYDIIMPSAYAVPVMVRDGLVETLTRSDIPTVMDNIDYKFKSHFHKDTFVHSVPYCFSVTGLAYRKDKIPEGHTVTNSWELLKDPVFGGRVGLFRDMREVLGVGLIMSGKSVNSTNAVDVQNALNYAMTLKRVAAKLDNEQYRTSLTSGEMRISMGYACDVLQIMLDMPDCPVEYFIPSEGSTCCWDEMVISKRSTKKDLALKFINFLYEPANSARNTIYICAPMPNANMWEHMEAKYREDKWYNLTADILDKLELIQDLGPNVEMYNKAWDEFTTNRD